jgi:AcrR family transcriptional regulator
MKRADPVHSNDAGGAARRRPRLDRDAITREALRLVEAEGVQAFSMRKLAARLDVTPMTIYAHFRDKHDLFDALSGAILADTVVPVLDVADWQESARTLFTSLRSQLLSRRDALELLGGDTHVAPVLVRFADAGMRIMQAAGFEGADAVRAYRLLSYFTLGEVRGATSWPVDRPDQPTRRQAVYGTLSTMAEGDVATFVSLMPHSVDMDWDDLFAYGLERLIASLESDPRRHAP